MITYSHQQISTARLNTATIRVTIYIRETILILAVLYVLYYLLWYSIKVVNSRLTLERQSSGDK